MQGEIRMENKPIRERKTPCEELLFTETISEKEFRYYAKLCLSCGEARETNRARHLCDQCETAELRFENHALYRDTLPSDIIRAA